MASESIKTSPSEEGGTKGKSSKSVIDQLQAPRKKRKSFVVLAVNESFDADTIQAIQRFLKSNSPKLSFALIRTKEELLKYASRNIILAIVDDEFDGRANTLPLIAKIKSLKTDGPLPTLFLTKDSQALVASYQKDLQIWQEVDEYIEMSDAPRHALFTKIKSGIENRFQRRGRRYKTSLPVFFQVLETGIQKFQGEILDFSVHGALLATQDKVHRFTPKDQILVHFPYGQFIKGEPDIVKVSAKVRRVLIGGDKAGISWEYLSEDKITAMTRLLTSIVDQKLAKSANATRAKISKSEAEAQLHRGAPNPPK